MLHWSLVFLIIAIIAAILGFGGIAGAAAGIAKILFIVFLVIWILAFFSRPKSALTLATAQQLLAVMSRAKTQYVMSTRMRNGFT